MDLLAPEQAGSVDFSDPFRNQIYDAIVD